LGITAAIALAAGTSAYSIDQSNQQKRLASQKADAAKIDAAAATANQQKIQDRDQNQAAQMATARRQRMLNPLNYGIPAPQGPTALGGAQGKTMLGS
jgi:hypothetical protein